METKADSPPPPPLVQQPVETLVATGSDGLVRVRRSAASSRVQQAIAHAASAVTEDNAGRYEAALEEYLVASELLLIAALEDNLPEQVLNVVRTKESEYITRAQVLSSCLKQAKAAARERTAEKVALSRSFNPNTLAKPGKDGLFGRLRANTEESALSDAARFAKLFDLPEALVGKANNQLYQCTLSSSTTEGKTLVAEQKAHVLLLGRYMYIATEAETASAEGYAERLLVTEILSIEKKRQNLMFTRIQLTTLRDQIYVLAWVKGELFDILNTKLAALREQEKVFGVPLNELLVREGRFALGIPKIVEETVEHISQHGLDQEGIFRISCDHMQLTRLVEKVDRGVAINWADEEIHACTGILKKYLRDLPQPLFSHELYACFMAIHTLLEGDTEQAAMAKIESLVRILPGPTLRLIKYLFDFLALVDTRSAANKMHLSNLALIFGPIMIGSEEGLNSEAFLRGADACNKLVLLMVSQKERFFPADLLASSQLTADESVPKYSSADLPVRRG